MKKSVKIIGLILLVILAGAWIYWQFNKKRIVRNAVENVIAKKTDSLYYIHYDSSTIDAVSGNASFYNVELQSDSLQKQLLQFDSASESVIYNIHVGEVTVLGADIPALVSNQRVEARSIKIIRPVIFIVQPVTSAGKPFTYRDTLAIYEKLLGKFKSIHASEIIIQDGQFNFSEKIEAPYISLRNINITLRNVRIDSSKNYDNLLSYFIKDVNATVGEAIIIDEKNNSVTNFKDVEYDAAKRFIRLAGFQQKDNRSGPIIFNINNTEIKGLNTDSFILRRQLKAEELSSDGGLMTFYSKKKDNAGNDEIEINNSFFDEALLNKVTLGKTNVHIYKKDRPGEAPFVINNVQFSASEIQNLYSGTNIKNLVGRSNWIISADGFSFITDNKIYKVSMGAFNISKATGKMHIDHFSVVPQVSEATFVKGLKEQTDLYNIVINNIDLSGIDTKKLIANEMLIAENAIIHPVIKVSCDRTIPPFTGSKVGNYPHQLIQKIKFPFYIKKIIARDGYISYTERGAVTEQQGTVFFSKANGTIENVTNSKEYINKNNMLTLNANTNLIGVGNLQTKWSLPLNTTTGEFRISGYIGGFNAELLNPLIEPLALASIKKGQIKSVNFNIYGTDDKANGTSTLLYNDLKLEALKKDSNELKKRGLLSFFANFLVRDDNPKNNETRKGEIDIKRDTTRSFFNLIWKGIFKAAKRTAVGKNDEE